MRKRASASATACVLLAICRLIAPESGKAQEAAPSATGVNSPEIYRNPLNEWKEKGIVFPVTLTAEVLGNLAGGTANTAIFESLLTAGIEVDFEKAAGVAGLSLSLGGLYPQGTGLTDKAVHDFNTLSNIDAYDSVRLYEAWLQQEFWAGKFSIRLGQILADAEFFVSDYGGLFINSSFGAIPLVSQNLDPPIFPVAAPGVRLRVTPSASFYAEAALFSGNVGDPVANNKHNTRLSFHGEDGALIFAEVGYRLNRRDDSSQSGSQSSAPESPLLSSSYKLGGYYDSGRFPDSDGEGSIHQGNFSLYFIAERELWHPNGNANRALSLFTRIGFAPKDRNTVVFSFDTGLNYQGVLARRTKDALGLGFSYTQLSPALVDDSGAKIATHHEAVLELTYVFVLDDHVSLQPDFQCIFNPGAVEPAPTAVVAGLRLNIAF